MPYRCSCGTRHLVRLDSYDDGGADGWKKTVEHVAERLGARALDGDARRVFVCDTCDALHIRQESAAPVSLVL
jgi:hypothetical protein